MKTDLDTRGNKFAAAVRSELADLSKTEIQELTDGLEADLEDRLAEEGSAFDPGSPVDYAAELRAAAGFSEKAGLRKFFKGIGFTPSLVAWLRKRESTSIILDFGISIQPFWWVVRAYVAFWLISSLVGGDIYAWPRDAVSYLTLTVLVVLSIQLGRKIWLVGKFWQAVLVPLNIFAIALSPVVLGSIANNIAYAESLDNYSQELSSQRDGLRYFGQEVTGIKAFTQNGVEVYNLNFTDQSGSELPGQLSANAGPIEVPDLTGMSLNEANRNLDEAGFLGADVVWLDETTGAEAVVLRTEPQAGVLISPETPVTLFVGLAGS